MWNNFEGKFLKLKPVKYKGKNAVLQRIFAENN